MPLKGSIIHRHLSRIWVCKTTLCNRDTHSDTNSSSNANIRLLHTQAPLPSTHPLLSISCTVTHLSTARSKRRGNCTCNGTPPTQLSIQKKVSPPPPTTLRTLSSNQLPLHPGAEPPIVQGVQLNPPSFYILPQLPYVFLYEPPHV